jgi:unspecific monooxygenase
MCPDGDLSPVVLGKLPFLSSVIYESLRLFPPISQLVNRRVDRPVNLGDKIYIPRDTYVGYNSYATNRDPSVWGPTADEFMPERWGTNGEDILKRFRRAKARAEFISFHGGSRACLGERFALLEMRITLFILVKNCTWTLDPHWPDRMTPVSSSVAHLLTKISELT